ncbi:hypothetical protein Goklo_005892 [Gossypium klotzschianum]|uniref:RNase H type-1 domain-containing protein n=1 Tax=Gossypium klotzschianum TaxID=34286 RepID=A0A7J8VFN6_9ROSI|nr:hypothetical protein [Gossypium klotzschianum]
MMVRERWKPPENPFVKINFDAAYKKDDNRSCSGIVIKDSDGRVLGSRIVLNENVLLKCNFRHGQRPMNEVPHLLATEGLREGEQSDMSSGVLGYAEEKVERNQ